MPRLWISTSVGDPPISRTADQAPPLHVYSTIRPVVTVPTYSRLMPSLRPGPTRMELFSVPVVPIEVTDQTTPEPIVNSNTAAWLRLPLVPMMLALYVPTLV